MKTKQLSLCRVPATMKDDLLSIGFSKTNLNKAIHFISLLKKKSSRQAKLYFSEVELPYVYLKKIYTSKFPLVINQLIDKGIVVRQDYYNPDKSICKKYSLAYKYFSKNPILQKNSSSLSVDSSSTCSVSNSNILVTERVEWAHLLYMSPLSSKNLVNTGVSDCTKSLIKKLKFDTKKLREEAEKIANEIDNLPFKIDDEITDTHFEVSRLMGNRLTSFWVTLEKALGIAQHEGISLIKDGGSFFLMNLQVYTAMKKDWVEDYNEECICKLEQGIITASRNETNNRLDSNFTNMDSRLLQIILEDNGLIQIDLANSQFAILANLLPETLLNKDTELFKEKAKEGKFYEFIRSKLKISSRKEAKQSTFEMLFSSHRNRSPRIDKVTQALPELMDFIKEYKIQNGSNQFAIWLQKYESNIFIDGILNSLHKKRIFALSKHDSIICKSKELDKVLPVIEKVFSKNKFEGKLVY